MPDMLVKLYDLPDEAPALARSHAFGVEIRRAMAPDRQRVLDWVRTHSGDCAAGECAVSFAHTPIGCWIATRGSEIVGYACYDATAPDFFGPTRVLDSEQGHGVGTALLHFVPGEQPAQTSRFVYDGKTLTTPLLQVQLDELGRITSLVTRADGMQWADGPMNTLLMAEDVSAGWDGWDIDADCMMKLQPAARLTKQTVTADGPQEFRLHSRYELGTATILEQDMIFRAESTLVEWQTVLHWNEKHRVLKAAFPTNLRAKTARHEIQFGYIERPTTANDTREQAMFERCNHRYTDLSEPGRGLSIFNDCKYGIRVQGGTMALTLAKGGTRPDERGDVGTYTFRYAIQPHAEGFSAKVPRRGMRFDRLPTVLAADAPSPALLTTSCRNVVVETVKPCEDAQNAMIVRLYECEGSHTAPVALHPGFAVTAAHQCDMAENAQFSVDLTNLAPFKPFEVRTVKIEY